MRFTRTPLTAPARNASFLVSTIFIVDTIFDRDQLPFKTVLAGRLPINAQLRRIKLYTSRSTRQDVIHRTLTLYSRVGLQLVDE